MKMVIIMNTKTLFDAQQIDLIEIISDFKEKGYEAYLTRPRENFGCDMFFLKK